MITFVVVQRGVYIQAIHGPYETRLMAVTAADHRAALDSDSYHTWEVTTITDEGLGEVTYMTRGVQRGMG